MQILAFSRPACTMGSGIVRMSLALISGGSGLIGTALARSLLVRGHRVVILTRNSTKQPAYGESVVWDGIHPGPWMDWIGKADWVVNLAGENIGAKLWTERRWQEIRESRVFPGELLTEAVIRSPVRPSTFLQMSAIGYYGIQSPSDKSSWDETTPPGNDRLANLCKEWESSSAKLESHNVRRLIIRTGLVLSHRGGVLPRLVLPYRFFIGGSLGGGRQIYSWIHLDDLVQGMLFLLENPEARGLYNLTSPQPVTQHEFGCMIGRVLRRPHWISVPAIIIKLILGEMSTLVLDGQRVLPARLLRETTFQFAFPSIESALANIYQNRT